MVHEKDHVSSSLNGKHDDDCRNFVLALYYLKLVKDN
jgi:hypothetical protein